MNLRRPLTAAVLAILAAGSISACKPVVGTNPVAAAVPEVFTGIGGGCVDAHGPNSTGKQLAESQITVMEKMFAPELVEEMNAGAPDTSESYKEWEQNLNAMAPDLPSELSNFNLVEEMQKSVPEEAAKYDKMDVSPGMDAAFADAVCGLDPEALLGDMPRFMMTRYVSADRVVRPLTTTPHALRTMGRDICWKAYEAGEYGSGFIENTYLTSDQRQLRDNPEDAIKSIVAEIDDTLANADDLGDMFGGVERLRWDMEKFRNKVQSYSPAELSALVREREEIARAALRYLCPQLGGNS